MGLRGKAESRMPGHCIIQPVEIVEKIQQNTNIGQCSSKHILRNHLYKTTQEWPSLASGSEYLLMRLMNLNYNSFPKSFLWATSWGIISKEFMLSRFSYVWLCVTPWTVARQITLSMGVSRQEYWSGLPFPNPGVWPRDRTCISFTSLALAGGFFTTSATWEAQRLPRSSFYLIFSTIQRSRHDYCQCMPRNTEVQRGEVTYSRSPSL